MCERSLIMKKTKTMAMDMDWVVDTPLKSDVAMEMIKGESSVEEICKKYNVKPEQAKTWAEVVYKSIHGDPEASEEIS
jgi:transposase-like protein